jgi:hypothetical protein
MIIIKREYFQFYDHHSPEGERKSTTETWCGMYTPQLMDNVHYMSDIVVTNIWIITRNKFNTLEVLNQRFPATAIYTVVGTMTTNNAVNLQYT